MDAIGLVPQRTKTLYFSSKMIANLSVRAHSLTRGFKYVHRVRIMMVSGIGGYSSGEKNKKSLVTFVTEVSPTLFFYHFSLRGRQSRDSEKSYTTVRSEMT